MIKSMTGYGKSSLCVNSREYQIEIKAVNHKYIDVNIKLPRIISYLEDEVRKYIISRIKRGKIDITITFENYGKDGNNIKINTELAKFYIESLKKLAEEENLSTEISVTEITKLPDVLTVKNDINENEIKQELLQTIEEATNQLIEMRKKEGAKISVDILNKIDQIEIKTNEILQLSTGLIEEYVVKLEERIKQILKDQEIDKSRLAEEVVIYADKCSIEEEITRLNSHIEQFNELLNSNDAVREKIRLYNTRDE